eukprot:2498176-Amphidinium_carterae.4
MCAEHMLAGRMRSRGKKPLEKPQQATPISCALVCAMARLVAPHANVKPTSACPENLVVVPPIPLGDLVRCGARGTWVWCTCWCCPALDGSCCNNYVNAGAVRIRNRSSVGWLHQQGGHRYGPSQVRWGGHLAST